MTNVNLIGVLKKENGAVFIEVVRAYKDQKGVFNKDLIPCLYWTKNDKNNLTYLPENSKLFIKGRLEVENQKLYLIVEEFTLI